MERKAQTLAAGKLESAAARTRIHLPAHLPPVFFLTDPKRTPDPVATAAALPNGWGLIYRHFGEANRKNIAKKLAAIASGRNLTLLISADPELALDIGADGVHWPEARLEDAAKWRSNFKVMTSSAHSVEAINMAARHKIDAVLRSVIFTSNSPSAKTAIGVEALRAEAETSPVPLYGLGGITAVNAARIADFAGLAAIEGIESVFGV